MSNLRYNDVKKLGGGGLITEFGALDENTASLN